MQKNRIEVAGYLGAKPTLRVLPSGTKVANARVAEGYRYQDKDKKTQEHTNWHNLSFYGTLADVAMTYDKGDNIAVEGSLQSRQFTPKDGSQRTVYEVIVKSCHLIGEPRLTRDVLDGAAGCEEAEVVGAAADVDWPA